MAVVADPGIAAFSGGAANYEYNQCNCSWWESGENAKAVADAGAQSTVGALTIATTVASGAAMLPDVAQEAGLRTNNVSLYSWGATQQGLLPPPQVATQNGPASAASPAPSAANSLSLPASTYANPRTGEIVSTVTQQETTLYRVASDPDNMAGRWLTPIRPTTSSEAMNGLALPPSNTASYVSEVTIPAGTRIQTSIASSLFGRPGGWPQAELLNRDPAVIFHSPTRLPVALLPGPRK